MPILPAGFDGPRFVARFIPGDWRLALHVQRITIFDGGVVYIRAVNGQEISSGSVNAPEVVEVDLPQGVRVVVPPGSGLRCCSGFHSVTDVGALAGGGSVPAGYVRFRLNKRHEYEWSYMNSAIELHVEVDSDLSGKTFPSAQIRAYSGSQNQLRSDNWQPLAIAVKDLMPAPVVPKRLHISFCYAVPRQFVDDRARGLSSIKTWRNLGFNTVPNDGASYFAKWTQDATPGGTPKIPVLAPNNRTGPAWIDMRYGVMTTPFTEEGLSAPPFGLGSFTALTRPPSAAYSTGLDGFNFSRHGLSASQQIVERQKWHNSLVFYDAYRTIDLSYDGWFVQNDVSAIEKLVNYTQADYLSMDIETLPQLEQWIEVGSNSKNFPTVKKDGERDSEALVRLGSAWVSAAVTAAKAVQPNIKVYFYNIWARFNAGYQSISWNMAEKIGLADMPSMYERPIQNDLRALAQNVRDERLTVGTSTELIPWLTPGQTPGTNGPKFAYPCLSMFNTLIQVFCAGATGFNMFDNDGVYDMGLWVAMRDAISLVAPHEDILMDGVPAATSTITNVSSNAIVSAMISADGASILIASSTVPPGRPTSFTVHAPQRSSWLCDLTTNKSISIENGAITWSSTRETGTVLLLSQNAACSGPTLVACTVPVV